MPANSNGTTGKRFELPALDFKFGSLTEGTDIPPPPPSPPMEAAVPTPAKPTTPKSAITPTRSMLDIGDAGKAPGSNGKKANDGEKVSPVQRPVSRLSTATSPDGKKIKRSSSWFSRLMSSESVAKSSPTSPTSPVVETKKPSGPPPPKLPELTKVQESELGEDLFKNIK